MGYRKAAKLRRTQHVSGHYRTSKSGKRYWVEGHIRNDPGPMGVSEGGRHCCDGDSGIDAWVDVYR